MRGWGRGLRNAVGGWYVERETGDLAHQAVKYQQRDGWSHSDLLRLAHPKGTADPGDLKSPSLPGASSGSPAGVWLIGNSRPVRLDSRSNSLGSASLPTPTN